jgi:hypothetical protein
MTDEELKDIILGKAQDAGLDFSAYDRKNDEELPVEMLENAMERGVVTKEEIAQSFIEGFDW